MTGPEGPIASTTLAMQIRSDDLSNPAVLDLLRQHRQSMFLHSPPESVHALDIEGLRKPEITFWCAWDGDELLGCGALKQLGERHGEVKSMRTVARHLRRGVARGLLAHMIDEARRRAYARLSLETGSGPPFEPARSLYAGFGFGYCGPFAEYVEDPHSVFMTRTL